MQPTAGERQALTLRIAALRRQVEEPGPRLATASHRGATAPGMRTPSMSPCGPFSPPQYPGMLETVIANACAANDPCAPEPPPLVGADACVNGIGDAPAARVLTGPSDGCHQRVVAQVRPQAGRTDSVDGSPESPLSVLPTITATTQDASPGALRYDHVSAEFSGDETERTPPATGRRRALFAGEPGSAHARVLATVRWRSTRGPGPLCRAADRGIVGADRSAVTR
jgi:hypothetical protein